ncbi:L-2-amino-thiazoline-4-carboxylic acid hydrolase [Candidatus Bathyarchaeota archaeon]|nr:L-2-amino-thiazoline-4-carboxylic acid hydrolase [Candidatus Bathyarchaeota archaeon]MBS7631134.1 L-2-amino-thiazoline-4-carboxylic acid hydrolase [Candidatus Bathyarchaeota archaeon]
MNLESFEKVDYSSGVIRSYILTFLLVMRIIEELGSDKGLQIFQEAVEKQAEIIVEQVKKKMPKNLSLLDSGIEAYKIFMGDAGAKVQVVEKKEEYAVFAVRRCPFYEALLGVNVDCGHLQGEICSNLAIPSIEAILKRIDPRFKIEPRSIRRSSEDICLEKIYL